MIEEKLAEEVMDKPKSFWCYVSQKCSSRHSVLDILHSQSVVDPELKVEIFNQYFPSVFSSNSSIVYPIPPLYEVSHKMEPILITDTLVLMELGSLKLNKSAG